MDFQKLLLDAGKALCRDEVKALAFLCTDLLARNPTSVESASDLFSRLAEQDHLSAEQPHLLTELLLIIQRSRLIRDLQLSHLTSSLISPYRKLLYNLSEEINDEDLRSVKFLLAPKLPRRKLEETVSILEIFLELEHMDLIRETNLTLLETIICSVCPMLKVRINQFKALQVTHTHPVAEQTGRTRSISYPSDPAQVSQALYPERTTSCEMSEDFRSLEGSTRSNSYTSMDLPNVFHGGDEGNALSHDLRGLSTTAGSGSSSNGHLRINALESTLPSQENRASCEKPHTTIATTEVLGTYPMTAAKRGICLIVNNYDFSKSIQGLKKREGTMLDEDCLRKVFKWLGFEVEIRRDCKREEMLSALRELGRRNHTQMDCLVCCVLSHGGEGCVYGVDGHAVKIKELLEPVNGSRCASLVQKPKLFFIQACQGTGEQKAVFVEADGPEGSSACSDAVKANESIPSDADFLLGMATVPSFVSFRERKNGTWFIQTLCQNLVQMVPSGSDLVSILTKVNADVSRQTTDGKKQMPQPAFSLRKKVVFPIPEAPPPICRPDNNNLRPV